MTSPGWSTPPEISVSLNGNAAWVHIPTQKIAFSSNLHTHDWAYLGLKYQFQPSAKSVSADAATNVRHRGNLESGR